MMNKLAETGITRPFEEFASPASFVTLHSQHALGAGAILNSLITSISNLAARFRSFVNKPNPHFGLLFTFGKAISIIFSFSLPAHLAVVRALSLPRVKCLTKHRPRFAYRYWGNYLAHGFCVNSRAAILANHYSFLNSHVAEDFVARICEDKIVLWDEFRDNSLYSIALLCPRISNFEGDLSLVFQEDSSTLFTMSFTFAPGKMLNIEENQVLLACLLQGARGKFDSIRRATKAFNEISPPSLLLSAAEAIAASLKITSIIGVGAQAQISVGGEQSENQGAFAYDDFWLSSGAEKINGHLFRVTTLQNEKPLSLIKSNHRSRVKRKRQFKASLVDQIGLTLRQSCLN